MIGDTDRAVAELRTAAEAGMPNYPAFMNDLHFAPLHDEPDFKDLMSGMKTGWEALRAEFGADPFYLVHNAEAWKHEQAIINLVGKFVKSLPSE